MLSSVLLFNIIFSNRLIHLIFIISFIIFFQSCVPVRKIEKVDILTNISKEREVRVKLSEATEIQIEFDQANILDIDNNKIFSSNNNVVKFSYNYNKIKSEINGRSFFSNQFLVIPSGGSNLKFNKISYRGYFKIIKNSSQILLVNYLDIEDYVKGVILKEMPLGKGRENYEALKAFSILSRTYVMKKKLETNQQFDTYADIRDQVYGGMSSENEITNRLVDLTKGQILSYNNRIATVFYHSTCGGFTENVENVFTSVPIPYLKTLEDDYPPNCKISPRFEWEESFTEKQLVSRLFEAKYISDKNVKISKIEILSRFNSGRVNELKFFLIENKKLKEISLFSNNIRFVLKNSKGSILRSTNFNIKISKNNDFIFYGKGYGHGVGLCQWGSISLSRKGLSFQKIINHYFPGTEIKKVYD